MLNKNDAQQFYKYDRSFNELLGLSELKNFEESYQNCF